jgi:hypothetical protein
VSTPALAERAALARAVAAAATAVPGVARLTGGGAVEAATLYPGGKVVGVVLDARAVTVHLVAGELPLAGLVARVRAAVAAVLAEVGATRDVDLVVEDLELPALPAQARVVEPGRGQEARVSGS